MPKWRRLLRAASKELSERIDKNLSYQDLRGAFPQRVHHHPALLVLTDSLLGDPAKFSHSVAQARRDEPFFVKTSTMPLVGAKHLTRARQHVTDRNPTPVVTVSTPVAGGRGRPQTTSSGVKPCPRTGHAPRAPDAHRAASGQGVRVRRLGSHPTPSQAARSKAPSTPGATPDALVRYS